MYKFQTIFISVVITFLSACGMAPHVSSAGISVSPAIRPPAAPPRWNPPQVAQWQIQLSSLPSVILPVDIYEIDGFDSNAQEVAAMHAKGVHVICYMDAGTWENWRPDASSFPAAILGASNGWPGERWLDIRQLAIVAPLILHRMDMCQSKGFDAVDPDNVDGFQNATGFALTANDQLNFNRFVAQAAHQRGLAVGLKNDLTQIPNLIGTFDWSTDEQCFEYQECAALQPIVQAHKAVLEIEYHLDVAQFCPQANALNFNALKKDINLTAYRVACR